MGTRDPFEARAVTSRRGGPVKQPLSRDSIVAAALELLTRDGLEGMSLRKVATALDTGPASLYAYVDGLKELHALVLDRALGSVNARGAASHGWRDRLMALLASYLRVLSRSPGLAQLALTTVAVGPNGLRLYETLLGLLEEAGVDRAAAALAVDLLVLYVTGLAAEQSKGLEPGDPAGAVARTVRAVSAEEYPHVHAAREHLLAGTGEERFTWAVDVMLRGILTTPVPKAGARPKPAKAAPARKTSARGR